MGMPKRHRACPRFLIVSPGGALSEPNDYRLIRAFMASVDEGAALLDAEPHLLEQRVGVGETPLHYLAEENQLEAVRFLHAHGADLEARNEFGESALRAAVLVAASDVAHYLIDNGADIHDVDTSRESMLHVAAQ